MKRTDEDRIAGQIAKTLALMCVRNTFLEQLHAGKTPVTRTSDYSDVKVIDGEGQEIPWMDVSRINDADMKKLMKQIVNRLYTWFARSEDVIFKSNMDRWIAVAQNWDEPELDHAFLGEIDKSTKS